jgi:hypothetical protein
MMYIVSKLDGCIDDLLAVMHSSSSVTCPGADI